MSKLAKKLLIGVGVIGLVAVGLAAIGEAAASATPKTSSCRTVVTDLSDRPDSGFYGGTWALDTMNRKTKICETAPGVYHATVKDSGTFVADHNPANGDSIGSTPGTVFGGFSQDFTAPEGFGGYVGNYDGQSYSGTNPSSSTNWVANVYGGPITSNGMNNDWSWTYKAKCKCGTQTWVDSNANGAGNPANGAGGIPGGEKCKTPHPKPVVVTPVAPTFNCAKCSNGELTKNQIVIPEVKGVQYYINGEKVDAGTYSEETGTYTVTVKALKGYLLKDKCKAKWSVTFKDVPCIQIPKVSPVTPQVTTGSCTDGKQGDDTVTIPVTEGIKYQDWQGNVSGTVNVKPGDTFELFALPEAGSQLGDLPNGWSLVNDYTAHIKITGPVVTCESSTPTPTPSTSVPPVKVPTTPLPVKHVVSHVAAAPVAPAVTTPSQKSSGLAFTGSEAPLYGSIALGLLGLGGLALLAGRRRREH